MQKKKRYEDLVLKLTPNCASVIFKVGSEGQKGIPLKMKLIIDDNSNEKESFLTASKETDHLNVKHWLEGRGSEKAKKFEFILDTTMQYWINEFSLKPLEKRSQEKEKE